MENINFKSSILTIVWKRLSVLVFSSTRSHLVVPNIITWTCFVWKMIKFCMQVVYFNIFHLKNNKLTMIDIKVASKVPVYIEGNQ